MAARGAFFTKCVFHSGCDFENAILKDATLRDVSFQGGVNLADTSFEGAKFEGSCSIAFDQNLVLRSNFKYVSSDWVRIYTSFTGIQQFINIAFCFGYFLLLFGKIFALSALATLQSRFLLDSETSVILNEAFLLDKGSPIWQLVFGGASPTFLSITVAVLILVYQVERYRLTNSIAPMIEDQKTDGVTPRQQNYTSLVARFKRNSLLGFFALSVFLIDLFFALTGVVYPLAPEFWARQPQ